MLFNEYQFLVGKISRQGAHKSVLQLIDQGVVELWHLPNNSKDIIVVSTDAGNAARIMAAKNLRKIESEIKRKIGIKRVEELPQTLLDLNDEL